MRNNSENLYLNLGQWFRRYPLKDFYLELWQSFCFVEQNHLCNFRKGHCGENSCEVIWNFLTSGSEGDVVYNKNIFT